MKISDIMSSHVLTVLPDASVRELWKILFSKHVNAIPVVDKKQSLLGIVTKEDLLKILYPDYQEYFADIGAIDDFEAMEQKVHELGSTKASAIMCKRVVYTREDTPVMRALSRMIVRSINQLPVLDERDRVVGMATKGDIFRALVKREIAQKRAASIISAPPIVKKKKKKTTSSK